MSRMLLIITAVMLLFAVAFSAAGCSEPSSPEPAATEPAADPGTEPAADPAAESGSGEALVQKQCTMCHTLDRVNDASYDAAGWTTTIERMEKNGLVIGEDEKAQIIEYLSTK